MRQNPEMNIPSERGHTWNQWLKEVGEARQTAPASIATSRVRTGILPEWKDTDSVEAWKWLMSMSAEDRLAALTLDRKEAVQTILRWHSL